jgi:hypothetical protein
VVNYRGDTTNSPGYCDDINLIQQTKGATFAIGFAIHTNSNSAPFSVAFNAPGTYSFYDDTALQSNTVGAFTTGYPVFQRHAQAVGDFWGKALMQTTQLVQKRIVVTYSAAMTIDASLGNEFDITVTNGTAFTINAPTNPIDGQRVTVTIRNTSGGAHGVITWNAVFKLAALGAIANGFSRSVDFKYNGTNWVQVGQTGVDIPN